MIDSGIILPFSSCSANKVPLNRVLIHLEKLFVPSLVWKIGKDERSLLIQEILALGVFETIANSRDKIVQMLFEALKDKMDDEDEEEWDLDDEEGEDE